MSNETRIVRARKTAKRLIVALDERNLKKIAMEFAKLITDLNNINYEEKND